MGVAFAGLGTLCIAYASVRQRQVERALDSGTFASTDERLVAALTVIGVLLGLGLIAAMLV